MSEEEIDNVLLCVGVNSFNRFQTFQDLIPKLSGKSYWYALRRSYEVSDNLYKYREIIKNCFLKNELQKEYLMSLEEKVYLDSLPEQITIYRGMTEKELRSKDFGCSWSLKSEVAEFFAYKYIRNFDTRRLSKTVHEITINKSEIIAFFNERKEFEVIFINKQQRN